MKIAKIVLRHKHTGKILKVTQSDWAQDLGKYAYRNYDRVSESRGDAEAEAAPETTSGLKVTSGLAQVEGTEVLDTIMTTSEDEPAVSVDAILEAGETLDAQSTPTENRMDGEGNTNAPAVKKTRGRPPKVSK